MRRPGPVLADPDADPPVYPWRGAPPHLATRAQLRSAGLRPGRQGVRGLLLWTSRRGGRPRTAGGHRYAYLYDTRAARPRLPLTPARAASLAAALAARRTCPAAVAAASTRCPPGTGSAIPASPRSASPPDHTRNQRHSRGGGPPQAGSGRCGRRGADREVSRADAKAGTLLTLATGALAALVTFARAGHVPPAAAVLLWLAAGATGAAIAVLLSVVRPILGGSRAVLAGHQALLGTPAAGLCAWQESRLRLLSALAVTGHSRLRRAVALLLAALALLAAAAPLTPTAVR